MVMGEVVAEAIWGWRPCTVGERSAAFAREVVARAAPATPARARALLFAAARLAEFGERVALEQKAKVKSDFTIQPEWRDSLYTRLVRAKIPLTRVQFDAAKDL